MQKAQAQHSASMYYEAICIKIILGTLANLQENNMLRYDWEKKPSKRKSLCQGVDADVGGAKKEPGKAHKREDA